MKHILILILSLYLITLSAQDTLQGCLFLDFEDIEGMDLFEGAEMSDQFEASFGLTFSLEGGGFPVLAEVGGSPAAAFGSAWGNDTPAPQDAALVGSFFLTDDGQLSGLTSPPVVLDFATAIDSFAGCILDMDFGEVFKIEAFGEFGDLILEDSIMAGDPNTGDGRATCWGFNLGNCTGMVYQIKFSGYREQAGAFGLGLDNFSFCYAGVNEAIDFTICEGDSITVNGETFNEEGIYEQLLFTSEGCDSLVYINLAVLPEYQQTINASFCSGQSLILNGETFTEGGEYEQILTTSDGCDSIINLILTENNVYSIFESYQICEGSTIDINGISYDQSGSYEQEFLTSAGCDSILNIEIDELEFLEGSITENLCDGDSIEINGQTFGEAGIFEQELIGSNGCDSILNIEIAVLPNYELNENFEICENDSIIYNGIVYGSAGSFEQNLMTSAGCDSIININVSVFPTYEVFENYEICDNQNITVNGIIYANHGEYEQNFQTVEGCDSIVFIAITENPSFEVFESVSICDNESIEINGVEYESEGDYVQDFLSAEGCDSTLYISIEVFPSFEVFESYTIFEGESVSVNGQDFFISGDYTQLFFTQNQCDSLVNIEIVVLPPPNPETYVLFDLNDCHAGTEYDEFTASYPVAAECGTLVASSILRANGYGHSCTPGVEGTEAVCISSMEECEYDPESDFKISFNLSVVPNLGEAVVISSFNFFEQAPETFLWSSGGTGPNNYPTLFGIRILRDNIEIYRETDISTNRDWNEQIFAFEDLDEFRFENPGVLTVELLPYCVIGNFSTVTAWDLDNLNLRGYCSLVSSQVSGRIATSNGMPLTNVDVKLNSVDFESSIPSDVDGFYAFENLPKAYSYNVSSGLDDDFLNGVSTLDLVLIQKHLLGVQPFESNKLLIAADINNSESVSALDLIELRKAILGIYTEYPNNSSWRFFDRQNVPELIWNWQETIEVTQNTIGSIDFEGIKIGDVNSSWNGFNSSPETRTEKSIDFIFQREADGISFIAAEQIKISGIQLSLELEDLGFIEITPEALPLSTNDYYFSEGLLTISWSQNDLILSKGEVLFSLQLQNPNALPKLNTLFDNELYQSSDLSKHEITLREKDNLTNDGLDEAFDVRVYPNPFEDYIYLELSGQLNEELDIKLFDLAGRCVYDSKIILSSTNQNLKLDLLNDTGESIYILKISSSTKTISKPLVSLR